MIASRHRSFPLIDITTTALIAMLLFLSACAARNKNNYTSPPGYDLLKPEKYSLPSALDEISGLSYYAKDTSVFAIDDEHGILYKIHLHENPLKIEDWKFSKSADYEDVVLLDSNFYVLKSKGVIEKLRFVTIDSIIVEPHKLPADEKNEFETLYYDPALAKLVMVCKNCEADDKTHISTWTYDPAAGSFAASDAINTTEIKKAFDVDGRIKPSAAAIHPITGELYVLASVNKLLLVLDKGHHVKNIYPLEPGLFKQPEGIAFSNSGDMIISNESAKTGSANILIYKYGKQNNQ
jgi:uncharacterized protein YjiK